MVFFLLAIFALHAVVGRTNRQSVVLIDHEGRQEGEMEQPLRMMAKDKIVAVVCAKGDIGKPEMCIGRTGTSPYQLIRRLDTTALKAKSQKSGSGRTDLKIVLREGGGTVEYAVLNKCYGHIEPVFSLTVVNQRVVLLDADDVLCGLGCFVLYWLLCVLYNFLDRQNILMIHVGIADIIHLSDGDQDAKAANRTIFPPHGGIWLFMFQGVEGYSAIFETDDNAVGFQDFHIQIVFGTFGIGV